MSLGKTQVEKDHNSVKILKMISKFKLDMYFTMLYPSVNFDASLQKLLIVNPKCATADIDTEVDMIPMCLPFFPGNIKMKIDVSVWI